jgi:creatinine amidohydrolase/Fe(II)-dependent formamide hydrolase-like protein
MKAYDLNWMQLEDYLRRDDRIVVPLGSTEQHAYLSLGTDSILAQRIAEEAAEPLGVTVLPVLAYGLTPKFAAFPGSPSLRPDTFRAVVRDLLDSLAGQGSHASSSSTATAETLRPRRSPRSGRRTETTRRPSTTNGSARRPTR